MTAQERQVIENKISDIKKELQEVHGLLAPGTELEQRQKRRIRHAQNHDRRFLLLRLRMPQRQIS